MLNSEMWYNNNKVPTHLILKISTTTIDERYDAIKYIL